MIDTVFRKNEGKEEAQDNVAQMKEGSADTMSSIKVEPPFTDYDKVHNKPFTVEHFELGSFWDVDGAYTKEVSTIEGYLRELIDKGEIDNSLKAVSKIMTTIEKTAGVKDTDSTVVKVGKVAAYTRFLSEVSDVKHKANKYGSTKQIRQD